MLQIGTITHCAHFTKVIRQAVALPTFFKHLSSKYSWSPNTRDDIDWATFQAAANNYKALDNHLLKLVYNQLPSRKHKLKSESWVPSKCRYCPHPETFNHLMQCIHPISVQFQQTLPNAVQRHCNVYHASMSFTSVIVQAIHGWLANAAVLRTTVTLERSHPIIAAQSKISWDAFRKGFISKRWRRFLASELSRQPPNSTNKMNIPVFLSTMIKIIWKNMSEFWHAHLDLVHHKSSPGPSPDKIDEMKTRIRLLHTRRIDAWLAVHREQYFFDDLETYLTTATSAQMKTYLLNYTPVIYASIREAIKVSDAHSVLQIGFTRTRLTNINLRRTSTNVCREVPIHPAHNRWRPTLGVLACFRNFFITTTPQTIPTQRPFQLLTENL
jgi:hypothetical protein